MNIENPIENKIKQISDHYGYETQSRQTIEEYAELIQAINKYWRNELECGNKNILEVPIGSPCENNLVEELADVQIMVWQMAYLLNANLVPTIEQKLDRQLERIKNGK